MKRQICWSLVAVITTLAYAEPSKHTITIRQGKTPVLQLRTTGETVVTPIGTKTVVQTPDMFLHIWPQNTGTTVNAAIEHVAQIIKGDVLKFKVKKKKTIDLGDIQGTWMQGTGVEADDEDDSRAEVVVFEVGGRVFVACIHGEEMAPGEHRAMMKVLKTARPPETKQNRPRKG